MALEPAWKEMEAREASASEWHRKQCPITQAGEELLAERQRMECQHALERRRWETKYARYLMQVIRPLEGTKKTA